MRLYAITDRHQLPGPPPGAEGNRDPARLAALVSLTRTWAEHNIDYIQIREKDLAPGDLLDLTQQIVAAVRAASQTTRVLVNGPAQIAFEAHADGVHLPASAASNAAEQARDLFFSTGRDAILSHSCHSISEVLKAKEESQRNPLATVANTLILYAPVFEKVLSIENISAETAPGPGITAQLPLESPLPGSGLDALAHAVDAARPIPVFALGGITLGNAPSCITAGATGIAAIRLFLNENWHNLAKS